MGIMIHDQQIIAGLAKLAERDGGTKAQALHRALLALGHSAAVEGPQLFPRERVTTKTWAIGTPPKSARR